MPGLIKVTPQQLQTISSNLNQGAAQIDTILRQLATQVAPLQGDWVGVGQVRFETAYTQWQTAQQNLHNALATISQMTAQAAVKYQDSDRGRGALLRAVERRSSRVGEDRDFSDG